MNCSALFGVPVYLLVDCLKFFIMLESLSKRSGVGFSAPMEEHHEETTRKEERSKSMTSSAMISLPRFPRCFSILSRLGTRSCIISAHAL